MTAGYTQCDFIDKRIDVLAQYALYTLFKRDVRGRTAALEMLAAVRVGTIQGIYKEDTRVPALAARRNGRGWWQIVPAGVDATTFDAPTPMIVFKRAAGSSRARLAIALERTWQSAALAKSPPPAPSGKPCPPRPSPVIEFPPDTITPDPPIPPIPVPPQQGCDKTEWSRRIDACIADTKRSVALCHASLARALVSCKAKPICNARAMAAYYRCLRQCRDALNACREAAEKATRCKEGDWNKRASEMGALFREVDEIDRELDELTLFDRSGAANSRRR
ncbi:hypothetical protein LVJ94_22005 [Pendulispora rubella]|uniref:Uncharacterized protein n=1 Tax=Pendulispora rubella TaxID=2741070 RepID=A0ABZ2LG42_9BACT